MCDSSCWRTWCCLWDSAKSKFVCSRQNGVSKYNIVEQNKDRKKSNKFQYSGPPCGDVGCIVGRFRELHSPSTSKLSGQNKFPSRDSQENAAEPLQNYFGIKRDMQQYNKSKGCVVSPRLTGRILLPLTLKILFHADCKRRNEEDHCL